MTIPAFPNQSMKPDASSGDISSPDVSVSNASKPIAPTASDETVRPGHLIKTIGMALALTGLFLLPQFLTHIPTGLIAPVSAGITTGGVRKVKPAEAFIIGLLLFLVITIPAPAAYIWFGFANHLPFIAIFVFSFVFGAYYGTLIGVSAWVGSKINQSKIGG